MHYIIIPCMRHHIARLLLPLQKPVHLFRFLRRELGLMHLLPQDLHPVAMILITVGLVKCCCKENISLLHYDNFNTSTYNYGIFLLLFEIMLPV